MFLLTLQRCGAAAACLILLILGPARLSEAQAADAAASQTTVDASKGGLTFSSGVNSLTIGARVQFRWTVDDRELSNTDTAGSGLGEDDGPLSRFDVPRMRVDLSGGVYRPWLRYTFKFELSRTPGEGSSKIKDAIIEIRPVGRDYRILAGQFKAPFGLQQLTSSGRLQFVDRAITDERFNPGRDMGVMFAGTVAGRTVGYEAGAFNGSGESLRQNNRAHLIAGRVFVQPFGRYDLSEGGVDATERTVLHIGGGARTGKQIRSRTTPGIVEEPDNETGVNLEFAYKTPRLYSTAEYFWTTGEQANPTVGPDIVSQGFHAQAGWMLVARRTELGALFAHITPDTRIDDAHLIEARGVFGHFWHGHNLKLQADAGIVTFGARYGTLSARARQGLPVLGPRIGGAQEFTDKQLRVQMQVAF